MFRYGLVRAIGKSLAERRGALCSPRRAEVHAGPSSEATTEIWVIARTTSYRKTSRALTERYTNLGGIGVGSLAEFIEAGSQSGTRKLRQLKVKSETPSTTTAHSRPESSMYPEKETSRFLAWTENEEVHGDE